MIVATSGISIAVPPIPSDYRGYVTVDGEPAPDGTIVYAEISNGTSTYRSANVTTKDGYYDDLVVVPIDDSFEGKLIYFYVKPPGKHVRIGNITEFHVGLVNKIVNLNYITVNRPPYKPANVEPTDGATNISINSTLTVHVIDPNNDEMDVDFYGREQGYPSFSLIGSIHVSNDSDASIVWGGLNYSKTYEWYAVANDSQFENTSAIWTFTTQVPPPNDYTLTVYIEPDDAGNVTLNPSGGTYEEGTVVNLTAHSYSGYIFDHWSGDASGTSPTIIITMNSNKTIVANFSEIQPVNHPPYKPANVEPTDGATNISINSTLTVHVIDPNNDEMDVDFYGREQGYPSFSLIGSIHVSNDSDASIVWGGLNYSKTYEWYVIVNDTYLENKSEIWKFMTKSYQNLNPIVKIVKPQKKTLYIFNKRICKFSKALVVGKIEVEVNANDPDGNISRVEFWINHHGSTHYTRKFVDDTPPFKWLWNEVAIGRYTIEVVAYDNQNSSVTKTIDVFMINLGFLSG